MKSHGWEHRELEWPSRPPLSTTLSSLLYAALCLLLPGKGSFPQLSRLHSSYIPSAAPLMSHLALGRKERRAEGPGLTEAFPMAPAGLPSPFTHTGNSANCKLLHTMPSPVLTSTNTGQAGWGRGTDRSRAESPYPLLLPPTPAPPVSPGVSGSNLRFPPALKIVLAARLPPVPLATASGLGILSDL